MDEYVLGFAFNHNASRVLLIEKLKPAWQAGKLNGIGGKIEPIDNSAHRAMVREFQEETGIPTHETEWQEYARMSGAGFKVSVFRAFFPSSVLASARSLTAETVHNLGVASDSPYAMTYRNLPYISNLPWLIEMALDFNHNKSGPGMLPAFAAQVHYGSEFN